MGNGFQSRAYTDLIEGKFMVTLLVFVLYRT